MTSIREEMWKARGILFNFAISDLKIRYRNSVLGVLWSFIEPLLLLAVLFLLFVPFSVFVITNFIPIETMSTTILYYSAVIASLLIYTGAVIEVKMGLKLRLIHALFAPLGGLVVTLGFLTGLIQAKGSSSVSWRGRSYSMKDHTQSSLSI